jgi:hypothetical protein
MAYDICEGISTIVGIWGTGLISAVEVAGTAHIRIEGGEKQSARLNMALEAAVGSVCAYCSMSTTNTDQDGICHFPESATQAITFQDGAALLNTGMTLTAWDKMGARSYIASPGRHQKVASK